MEEEDYKISTSLIVYKISKEFTGVLNYERLVRLRQRLKYLTTDIIRLLSFKREAIENAIFT